MHSTLRSEPSSVTDNLMTLHQSSKITLTPPYQARPFLKSSIPKPTYPPRNHSNPLVPPNSDIEPKARMGRNPKWSMTHDIKPKIIHRHQGNQKIKSDFPPAVPHWRYSPLYWGKSQIGPFPAKFKEKMQKKEEAPSLAGCTHDHEIRMKKIQILQETAKIKIIFRRRSPLGDFSPKVPKWAFSP